jgi:hypothetical protein
MTQCSGYVNIFYGSRIRGSVIINKGSGSGDQLINDPDPVPI